MSTEVWVAVIVSFASIAVALINQWRIGNKLNVIHEQTNSMNKALTERNEKLQSEAVASANRRKK